ncbi:MAG TPA: hypothetical protein VNL71_23195 [Chloroflexota bacterium]|nr:hypothetical protein [Chloroflexota bacterium]
MFAALSARADALPRTLDELLTSDLGALNEIIYEVHLPAIAHPEGGE